MDALKIIGCTLTGAFIGAIIGGIRGANEPGDDFGIGVFMYGVGGVIAGGLVGVVAGALAFA